MKIEEMIKGACNCAIGNIVESMTMDIYTDLGCLLEETEDSMLDSLEDVLENEVDKCLEPLIFDEMKHKFYSVLRKNLKSPMFTINYNEEN